VKKLYLLLFSFAFLFTKAQSDFRFADSTAQWGVLETQYPFWCPCYNWTTHHFSVVKDTLINGLNYQLVRENSLHDKFIRKDSTGEVFYRNRYDPAEFKIYDFGKVAGDTFRMNSEYSAAFGPVLMYVCSTDTVNFDKPRKRMYLSPFDMAGCNSPHNIAIEGIGMLNAHLFYPELENYIIDGPVYSLLCFSENGSLVYHDVNYQSCSIDSVVWLGFNETTQTTVTVRYEFSNKVVVVNGSSTISKFSLYDLTGRLLLQQELTEQPTRIDLNTFAKGVYLYGVSSDKLPLKSGRLFIE
jgi:hypothetical protein